MKIHGKARLASHHRLLSVSTLALAGFYSPQIFAQSAPASPQSKPQATTATQPQQSDRASAYYHYTLAHMYEEMATTYGRPEYANRAIEEYKLALNADPDSPYLNAHLAELYFDTGRVRDAIAAAQSEIQKDPDNLEAHKLLGRIYLRSLGNMQNGPSEQMLKKAIDEYKEIVRLEPGSTEDHLFLGRLYMLDHDSVHAEEQFKAAQKIDPDSEDVVLNIAGLYSEQGDFQRAAQILQALPEDDQTPKTLYALGQIYDQLKDNKKALDAYQKAYDLEPDNLDVERALAQSQMNNGQKDAALKSFKDISSGDPSDAQSLLSIAKIERQQGKYEDALASLKKAKDLVSDSLEINFEEALDYDALGQFDQAAQVLSKLVADSEHPSGAYSQGEKNNRAVFLDRLANVYREQGKTDQAIATYQKMADLGGDYTSRAYQNMVNVYRDAHQYDKATAIAREAVTRLANDKDNLRDAKLTLASQLCDTGKADEGISLARSLLNGNTDNDRMVYFQMAEMYIRMKRWKDAEDIINQADQISTKPDDKANVYFERGELEERQKHYDQAESWFRKVLDLQPNSAVTLNYLGYMLADRGVKLNEALAMIKKAVQLDPQQYAYLDSLGWVYFKLGDYTLAEENLTKALARNSGDPTVHDHLGEVYEKTNRLKLAAAQWEQSLNYYAHSLSADADPSDVSKVQKKLDSARVRLAKESSNTLASPK
ncbi:MAG TPA: tetratricopeptide repeat protein [Pseudacidobacterium sp.]|nr:tetratricopeptide repeat protein [Pseudacidobacterium sp.]